MAVVPCHVTVTGPRAASGKRKVYEAAAFEVTEVATTPLISRFVARTFVTDSLKTTVSKARLVTSPPGAGVMD